MNKRSNYIEIFRVERLLSDELLNQEIVNARDLYKIVFIEQGGVEILVNGEVFEVTSFSIYFIAPNQITALKSYQPSTTGYCIRFDADFFLLCLKNQVKLSFFPFFQLDKHPVLSLDHSGWCDIEHLVLKLKNEYERRISFNDEVLVKLYLNILLIELERQYKTENAAIFKVALSRKHQITSKFQQLVEDNFLTLRKVSDYSDSLTMATNYLNDVVKETTGHSASELIQNRLLIEAKAMLLQTELTISEIAAKLHFNDNSYFCRFFKRHTGESPQEFRKTHQARA